MLLREMSRIEICKAQNGCNEARPVSAKEIEKSIGKSSELNTGTDSLIRYPVRSNEVRRGSEARDVGNDPESTLFDTLRNRSEVKFEKSTSAPSRRLPAKLLRRGIREYRSEMRG